MANTVKTRERRSSPNAAICCLRRAETPLRSRPMPTAPAHERHHRLLTGWVAAIGFSLLLHGAVLLVLARALPSREPVPVRMQLDLRLGDLAPAMVPLRDADSGASTLSDNDASTPVVAVPPAPDTAVHDGTTRGVQRVAKPDPAPATIGIPIDRRSPALAELRTEHAPPVTMPDIAAAPIASKRLQSADAAPAADAFASTAAVELHLLDWLREHRVYPRAARRSRLQGRVELHFMIDRGGVVSELRIAASSGHAVLDRAAERLVRDASPFASMPPMHADRVEVRLPVDYSLDATFARRRP